MLREITSASIMFPLSLSAPIQRKGPTSLKALSLGAFDFVRKPQDAALGHIEQIASELAVKIRAASHPGAPKLIITGASVGNRSSRKPWRKSPLFHLEWWARSLNRDNSNALRSTCFRNSRKTLQEHLIVVQHMPESGFTEMFARRLMESSA